ncbi:hypothetical protein IQ241_13905 [Romeria aff. gracilis LEGE 07310]|uniref:Uncharacterized protein n=1 Tax=Vasconcelosia minhoensis LEGE 07310 TaxID=915328 RepID=A0A8J7ANL2_9CYAN|nr:hypothetical protein [Romeria gracilis]MBE9078375.1 hypothetical protein [Romeria aff. gracilis LEGE 07310]
MKSATVLVCLISLLAACRPETTPSQPPQSQPESNPAASQTANPQNCPEASQPQPLTIPEQEFPLDQFNFQPQQIEADADTVTFETPHYRFVYCRGDRGWSVEAAAQSEPASVSYEQSLRNIQDPDYETIEVNGETYQYRVRLEAEWLNQRLDQADEQTAPPPEPDPNQEKVIFELKRPDQTEPIAQTVYTLAELRAADLGASLGLPRMGGVAAVGDSIWWAIAFEHSEGASGIASLLRYDIQEQALTLLQPEALEREQFTDLVVTGDPTKPTLWLGTQRSGEGNPTLPGQGLVAYRPEGSGAEGGVTAYTVSNSPLVGAIPYRLRLEADRLWVGTGNGVCELQWQRANQPDSWNCWRFTARAELPPEGVPLYPSSLAETPAETLNQDTVEVLWFARTGSAAEGELPPGRYEVVYRPGFEVTLDDRGGEVWPFLADTKQNRDRVAPDTIWWAGREWHWNGSQFVRGLDEVSLNYVGGGPHGIESSTYTADYLANHYALRGAFELMALSANRTQVRHYSGWVEADAIAPYPTVVPHSPPAQPKPNPLVAIAPELPEEQRP